MNPTIAKYRRFIEEADPSGFNMVVNIADLAALLDIAEAAQSIIASNANIQSGWRTIADALARLNGDKA